MVYKWFILPIGGLYATYHLLGEPETTIDFRLLAQTLPLESACQLLVHALSSRPLLHQAAVTGRGEISVTGGFSFFGV